MELKRRKPPEGIDAKVVLSVEEFEKLTPVTGDPDQMVADLVYLPDVNTGAVLHNLKLRYQNDEIFTAIGPILVVVNPYKTLAINSAEHMTSMTEASTSRQSRRHPAQPRRRRRLWLRA